MRFSPRRSRSGRVSGPCTATKNPLGPMSNRRILAGLFLGALTACSTQANPVPTVEIADSAGVQVVTNRISEEMSAMAWTLDMEPSLAIGEISGRPEAMLYGVSGARRLGDGRIVIANAGTSELRFFDSEGSYLKSAGRQGEGPGEFRELTRMEVTHLDSVVVFDQPSRRISLFDHEGNFARSFAAPSFRDLPTYPVGVFSDGTFPVRTLTIYPEGDERTGVTRDPIHYLRVDPEGEILNEIGSFPGNEAYRPSRESGYIVFSLPLLRVTRDAVVGMDLLVGQAHTFEVQIHGSDGAPKRIVRWADIPDPITEDDTEKVVAVRLERARDEAQRIEWSAVFRTAKFPDILPAYGQIIADVRGNLWVEGYQSPDLPRTVEGRSLWKVFSPEGEWLSDVELPSSFFVTQIGDDFVLGIRRDELGIERVEIHTLRKEGGAAAP